MCVYKYQSATVDEKTEKVPEKQELSGVAAGSTGSSVRLKQLADELIRSKRVEGDGGGEKISENGEKFLAVLEKLDQLMVPKINDDADRNEAKLEGEKIYD